MDNEKKLTILKEKNVPVYSISRIDCINHCLYEAYRTYRLGTRGRQNIYGLLGGKIHEVLENITNGTATEEDLLPAMYEELNDAEFAGLSFPKDFNGGDTIKDGWIKDMTHFCTTYKAPKANLRTEQLFIYTTTKGHVLQGYIDLQRINKNGSIDIYDYKTSTMYSGEELKKHGRQLVIYAMGKEQEGFQVNSVQWIFLKYVTIKFMGKKTSKSKNKSLIEKNIERKKIGTEMRKYVETDMIEMGYDDLDVNIYLDEFEKENSFDILPDKVRQLYKMSPCVVKYDLDDDTRKECEDYINNTIEMWESLGNDETQYVPLKFTKLNKSGKEVENTFYCSQLCSHSSECIYYKEHLDTLQLNKDEEEDLFA